MRKGVDADPLTGFRPPYGVKELKRRKAARKVAHESRRRNQQGR